MSLVSLVRIRNENLGEAISRSLDLIGFKFPNGIRNVVIKPNLCYYLDYTTGYTTDPSFVAAYAEVLRNRISKRLKIYVVESDASAMKCKYAFRMLGYDKMTRRCGLELVNLSEDKSEKVQVQIKDLNFSFRVPSTIQKADLLINIPKLKYMVRTVKITCALKNIFGCIPYPSKFRYHEKLGETIVAINKIVKPDLCTVDGNVVYGDGTRKLGLTMSSRDGVSIDAACAKILGISPRRIKYLLIAEKEKLGHISFETRGVPLNYFAAKYPRQKFYTNLKNQIFYYVTKFGVGGRIGLE